jgi:nucleoside-diphosphate-sugar epimerase
MRLLVTGATGFVGRRLCDRLENEGYFVRAAVRDRESAQRVGGEIAVVGAIDESTNWAHPLAGVDVIVHLAARVHIMKDTASDPLAAFRTVNVRGTENLAWAAARQDVRRFVYVSSIIVNGESTTSDALRADQPPRPEDPYAVSKCEAEQVLRQIANATGLEVAIVRPPLVYGPRVRGNFLRLLSVVRRGIPLPFASVTNRRSMIYVDNLASALVACVVNPRAAGHTYLVSDNDDLSTPELVRRIGNAIGKQARLLHCPVSVLRAAAALSGKSHQMKRLIGSLQIDISAIRADLGWSPPFNVDEGLSDTARWFVSESRRCPL